MKLRESAGTHITMDAFVSDPTVFTAPALTDLFQAIARALGMTVLQGPDFLMRVGLLVSVSPINKSHMSLHAWPLQSFFSCDVFSCDDFEPEIPFGIIRAL